MPYFMDLVTAESPASSKSRKFSPIYTPTGLDGKPLRSRLDKVPRDIDVSTLLSRAHANGLRLRYYVTNDLFGDNPVTEQEKQSIEQMFCHLALHLADVWGALVGAVDVHFEGNVFRVRAQLLFDDGEEVVRFAVERSRVRVRSVYARFEEVVKAHYES